LWAFAPPGYDTAEVGSVRFIAPEDPAMRSLRPQAVARRAVAALLAAAVLAAGAPRAAAEPPRTAAQVKAALAEKVKFPGVDDPKTSIHEVVDLLTAQWDVPIKVNEEAFKAAGVADVMSVPVAAAKPLPKADNVPRARVLDELVSRLPREAAPSYVARNGYVEITTRRPPRPGVRPGAPPSGT
jgi:hypothetical protein